MMIGMGLSLPLGGSVRDIAAAIRALFAAGEQGAWYDPSDFSTLFQDSAGTTPVTAVQQPVGLMRDKSGRNNHATQATAASRPVLSARVNFLTQTENFSNAVWVLNNASITVNAATAPNGTTEATLVTATGLGNDFIFQGGGLPNGTPGTFSLFVKNFNAIGSRLMARSGITSMELALNWSGAVLSSVAVVTGIAASFTALENGWYRVTVQFTPSEVNQYIRIYGDGISSAAGVGIYCWRPQIETGPVATRYQRVNTATDYDTVGFPYYAAFDGIDDGLRTASFPAGTLGSNMDCFIAVKRNSPASAMLACSRSNGPSNFVGCIESGGGGACMSNVGEAASCAVNNVLLAGGAGASRGLLHLSVPIGEWVIVEFRNLILSVGWVEFSTAYGSPYANNCGFGPIILCPAQSDAKRTQIRQFLAAKVGVTLP